jgi:hypothetical protein
MRKDTLSGDALRSLKNGGRKNINLYLSLLLTKKKGGPGGHPLAGVWGQSPQSMVDPIGGQKRVSSMDCAFVRSKIDGPAAQFLLEKVTKKTPIHFLGTF